VIFVILLWFYFILFL